MNEYTNRALSIEEQITRLKDNGLIIDDAKVAHKYLSIISYFRLASYWRPMEKSPHQFKLNGIYENNDFVIKFKSLLLKYPNVDITAMGFPKNWEEEPLWR